MTVLEIDPDGDAPPFEQLRSQIAAMVADETMTPGQKLPTVRQLASDLGLATNTVARAYRELEADGILSTQGRRGTFVRSKALDAPAPVQSDALDAAASLATTARRIGLSLAETTRLVELSWSQGNRT